MGNNTRGKKERSEKIRNPFYVDDQVLAIVRRDLRKYSSLKETAALQATIEVTLHSPGNITNPGGGRSSDISRPVEQTVEQHQKRLDEIDNARRKVAAIDRGIQECSEYASIAIRRNVRSGVRQILINQCYSVSTNSICAPKTLRKYCKIAMFFIAYYMGYIADEELEGRVFPNKVLNEVSQSDTFYPWEMQENSTMARTMARRRYYDEERKRKKAERTEKNRDKKEQRRLMRELESNGPPETEAILTADISDDKNEKTGQERTHKE